jgi:tetratricopeptide (TPR) repeat protein
MGRSRALFAAGEYVSSALYLCRALAIRPDYAKSKMDLVTLLGDRSRLAGRIADLEQWSARSGSPQLGLLLGYVYLQVGKVNEAAKAVEAAGAKILQSGAVAAAKATRARTGILNRERHTGDLIRLVCSQSDGPYLEMLFSSWA